MSRPRVQLGGVTTAILIPSPRRELAFRTSGGLEITLYWDPDRNSTSVEVHQPATQETIAFAVANRHALDAFYHPFAHLGGDARSALRRPLPRRSDPVEQT